MKPCDFGCGTEVRFVLMAEEDGVKKWSGPMEAVGRTVKTHRRPKGFEMPDLTVTERFTPHQCEEGDRARQEQRQKQQTAHAMHEDWKRKQASAWGEALKRPCPKCGKGSGDRCVNLSDVRRTITPPRDVGYPHAERLPKDWEPS